MTNPNWSAVDQYFTTTLLQPDPTLNAALAANAAASLPEHDVAPNQGKLLHILAKMQSARRILEIGTLGGYSTIWLARALAPADRLITLEFDPRHAEVARTNITNAGLSHLVEIRIGPALDSLAQLIADKAVAFDLIFIDADKPNNPHYLEAALKLSRPGTLIIGDNVVRDGSILDPNSPDDRVRGVRTFLEQMGQNPRLFATALQTVGSKGWDGFAMALVLPEPKNIKSWDQIFSSLDEAVALEGPLELERDMRLLEE